MFYGETLQAKSIKNAESHIKRTKIGPDVWIGDNAFIKSGITIGAGAIIGASSTVTKDVQPYTIVGGNPAKVISTRFEKNIIEELINITWWDLDITDLEGVTFDKINTAIMQIKKIKEGKKKKDKT